VKNDVQICNAKRFLECTKANEISGTTITITSEIAFLQPKLMFEIRVVHEGFQPTKQRNERHSSLASGEGGL